MFVVALRVFWGLRPRDWGLRTEDCSIISSWLHFSTLWIQDLHITYIHFRKCFWIRFDYFCFSFFNCFRYLFITFSLRIFYFELLFNFSICNFFFRFRNGLLNFNLLFFYNCAIVNSPSLYPECLRLMSTGIVSIW